MLTTKVALIGAPILVLAAFAAGAMVNTSSKDLTTQLATAPVVAAGTLPTTDQTTPPSVEPQLTALLEIANPFDVTGQDTKFVTDNADELPTLSSITEYQIVNPSDAVVTLYNDNITQMLSNSDLSAAGSAVIMQQFNFSVRGSVMVDNSSTIPNLTWESTEIQSMAPGDRAVVSFVTNDGGQSWIGRIETIAPDI